MIVFPIAAALVSLVFGVHLLMRFSRRGTPHEGVWAVAMLMFAAASVALALGVWGRWTSGEFRAYWLFGAVLTVPYLAQGELYLLLRHRWLGHLLFAVLLAATAWAMAEIRAAEVDAAALTEEFPLGREVFGDGSAAHRLAQFYSFPAYFLLLGGAVYAAARMRGREELRTRFYGVALLAVGATVVAVGSGIGAGFGSFPLFSAALAAGVAVMYWGFLVAAGSERPTAAGPSPAAGA